MIETFRQSFVKSCSWFGKVAFLFTIGINLSLVALAQETENELWSGTKFRVELNKKWQISIEEELRFREEDSQLDRHLAEFNLQYEPSKSVQFTFGLRYTGEFDREGGRQGYREYMRYQLDVEHAMEPKRFTIKNRVRYQLRSQIENPTFRPENNRANLRWKSSFGYNIRDWKWDPEFVAELFYQMEDGLESELSAYRVGMKSEYSFGDHEIGIGYLRENGLGEDAGESANILQIGYSYKFKLKKKKKK